MPMKLNVGLSRKVGERNFGSRGASCNVELELDPTTLSQDPARFHQQVRKAFDACRQAVQEELSRVPAGEDANHQGNRPSNLNPVGRRAANDKATRPATENQVKAIRAIAQRAGVQLEPALSQRYHVHSPRALSLAQASQLIDALKDRLGPQPIAG